MTGVRRLLRALDRLLDRELSLTVLPGLAGVFVGLWGGLIPDAVADHGLGWVVAVPSTWTPRERWFAGFSLVLLLLLAALGRQWVHQHAVKTRGGVLLAIDEQGHERSASVVALADVGTDYLEVIEVPGPKTLDAGWHWAADESSGPRWDAALDQLVYGVRTYQCAVAEGPMPALVTWVDWPVALGLGQRLGGGYSGRNRPQRIVPRSSAGRAPTPESVSGFGRPQIIVPTAGYSLTERLHRSEYRWPTGLGTGRATGTVPSLLLIRATGQAWGSLPCEGEGATAQRRPLALRDASGLGLALTGDHEVHEFRWHLPDAPDRTVYVEPRDTVNLAQDIAGWVDRQVRQAPGDVLLGMLVPPAVAFAVGVLWAQFLRANPLTGRRVLPIVYDRARDGLAVVGLDLSRTAPRAVLSSPGIGASDAGSRPVIGEAQL